MFVNLEAAGAGAGREVLFQVNTHSTYFDFPPIAVLYV